jgi:hypothetical protein
VIKEPIKQSEKPLPYNIHSNGFSEFFQVTGRDLRCKKLSEQKQLLSKESPMKAHYLEQVAQTFKKCKENHYEIQNCKEEEPS